MLDYVDRAGDVCVVVREREFTQVRHDIGAERRALLLNAALERDLLAVYVKIDPDPAILFLVSGAQIEPNKAAHCDPINCGLNLCCV